MTLNYLRQSHPPDQPLRGHGCTHLQELNETGAAHAVHMRESDPLLGPLQGIFCIDVLPRLMLCPLATFATELLLRSNARLRTDARNKNEIHGAPWRPITHQGASVCNLRDVRDLRVIGSFISANGSPRRASSPRLPDARRSWWADKYARREPFRPDGIIITLRTTLRRTVGCATPPFAGVEALRRLP